MLSTCSHTELYIQPEVNLLLSPSYPTVWSEVEKWTTYSVACIVSFWDWQICRAFGHQVGGGRFDFYYLVHMLPGKLPSLQCIHSYLGLSIQKWLVSCIHSAHQLISRGLACITSKEMKWIWMAELLTGQVSWEVSNFNIFILACTLAKDPFILCSSVCKLIRTVYFVLDAFGLLLS